MAVNIQVCCLIVLLSRFLSVYNLGIRIKIFPEQYDLVSTESVHISCTPDGDLSLIKEILLIEIHKDHKPIVVLHQGSKLSYSNGSNTRFQAVGHNDKDVDLSYLNLTLMTPDSEDSGKYTCLMYFLNQIDIPKEERDSKILTEDSKLDLKSIKASLKYLKDRILTLEMTSKQEDNDLKNEVSYQCAFSVTNNYRFKVQNGKLVLSDVILQIGRGYNIYTGIFTAQHDGLYVFHLVVYDWKHDCYLKMEIQANYKPVARLFAGDDYSDDQSSISTVVHLRVGNTVFTNVIDGNCAVQNEMYTVFSGYLIKAD